MPDANLSTIIERLEAEGESNLPDDLTTARELAHALREILTVGGNVNRYLFGKRASVMLAYGASAEKTVAQEISESPTRRLTHLDPEVQTMPRRSATLTVGGIDFDEGWARMKDSVDRELAKFGEMDKRPAGVLVSRALANVIGEKLGDPEMTAGDMAALHYGGITVIVSEKIYGFGWEWIW